MRRGFTLLEVIIVITVIGAAVAIAAPHIAPWMDRRAVSRAARELVTFYNQARMSAIFRGRQVRLEFAPDTLRAVFEAVTDSLFLTRPGPARHAVSLKASRSVIRIYPNGFGRGAANTKLVIQRGVAAESLTTSRLGRLKRW